MSAESAPLRFDRREVALAFALFVFVALLLFTVGVVVGKGLAQSRYEALLLRMAQTSPSLPSVPTQGLAPQAMAPHRETRTTESVAPKVDVHDTTKRATDSNEMATPKAKDEPAVPKWYEFRQSDKATTKRGLAALSGDLAVPDSFSAGRYMVQVGSYATREEADERVTQLKKLGFPYAHLSVKELGDPKETWYRVWLGYYVDYDSAKKSGELLQERGEVKNYLVRKVDPAG